MGGEASAIASLLDLRDTHSGCWFPPSSFCSSASKGMQVPRAAGEAVNIGEDGLTAAALRV